MLHIFFFICVIIGFSEYRNKSLLFLSFWLIGIFAFLRYDYGNDYWSYFSCYEEIQCGGENPFTHEYLFYLLNRLSPCFCILIGAVSVFFLGVIYKMIRDHLDGVFRGVALLIFLVNPYLFLMNLSALRQCIALCIFILATPCAQQRKFLKYAALIAVAALFHTSAVVLLPFYFVANERKVKWYHMAINVAVVGILLLDGKLLNNMVRFVLNVFDNPNYNYLYEQGLTNSLRATILTGISFAYVALNLKHLKGYSLICGKLYLTGLALGVLAYRLAMLTRIQMYFDIFSLIAIAEILHHHATAQEGKWRKLIHLYVFPALIFTVYILRYYAFFTNPMWSDFKTYHTIFEALL